MNKKSAIILSVITLTLCFGGCKEEKDTSYTGAYNGSVIEVLGNNTPIEEVFANGENSVILNEDGTGVITVDGISIPVNYTLEDGAITIQAQAGAENMICEGTLSGNVLEFEFFDLGFRITFTR